MKAAAADPPPMMVTASSAGEGFAGDGADGGGAGGLGGGNEGGGGGEGGNEGGARVGRCTKTAPLSSTLTPAAVTIALVVEPLTLWPPGPSATLAPKLSPACE